MKQSLGAFGESWAAGYLTRAGYQIIDRNVRYRTGEIDIVAADGADLVFVEVKCRRSRAYGGPEEAVTARRFQRLAGAIQQYLGQAELEPESYRVDVIALMVDGSGRVIKCDHLKGIESPAR